MLIDLTHNVALLLSLTILYAFLARIRVNGSWRDRVLAGLLFGGVAVAGMRMPFRFGPGLIFDGRPIVLAMAKEAVILLVEDDDRILELSRNILQRCGYQVLAASSPNEALELAATHAENIHLLVTDVVMPEMNGLELRDRVAAIKPGIKSLFMSGYSGEVIEQRGLLEPETQLLQKPFTVVELAQAVRRALGG